MRTTFRSWQHTGLCLCNMHLYIIYVCAFMQEFTSQKCKFFIPCIILHDTIVMILLERHAIHVWQNNGTYLLLCTDYSDKTLDHPRRAWCPSASDRHGLCRTKFSRISYEFSTFQSICVAQTRQCSFVHSHDEAEHACSLVLNVYILSPWWL